MIYEKVADFRKDLRNAFNLAQAGEDVRVYRHGTLFELRLVVVTGSVRGKRLFKVKAPNIIQLPDGKKIKVDPEAKPAPKCCTLKKRCKHWLFDANNGVWLNSITGETREAES